MHDEKSNKMIFLTMTASIISVLLLAAILIGLKGMTGLATGKRDAPVCLWQIMGNDVETNHLIYDISVCENVFDRYADVGGCSTQPGYLIYKDGNNNDIRWNYDSFCYKNIEDKRMFTIYSGRLG